VRHKDRVQAVLSYNSSQSIGIPDRTARLEKALAKHHMVFLAMTFLIYSTISTAVFQTFACDRVDEKVVTAKTRYLRADYSVQCDTAEHKLYKAYASVMIVIYPLGIPLLYTWLLWRSREKLSTEKDASGRVLDRHEDVSLLSTKFLWKRYRHEMYYWEVAECVRRLLLTGAIVFIAPGTTAQAAIACILAVVSGFIATQCKPHASSVDGYIYTIGSLIIFFSMFMSLAMKSDISKETDDSRNALGVVLILINAIMIGATVVKIALVGRKAVDLKKEFDSNNNNNSNNNDDDNDNNINNNNSSSAVVHRQPERVIDEEQHQPTNAMKF
jgi:hypothetical protein